MIEAIRYQFGHLLDFSGRNGRGRFLWWFLFVFVLGFLLAILAMIPAMGDAIGSGMAAARSGTEDDIDAAILRSMAERADQMAIIGVVFGAVKLFLLAAATVRRLHDIGRSGFWALIVAVIYVGSVLIGWQQSAEMAAAIKDAGAEFTAMEQGARALENQAEAETQIATLLYYASLIALLIIGLLKSQPSTNKWGEPPLA